MSEPCMCGASDCKRCYPGNFEGNICMVDLTCANCRRDWAAETLDEYEDGICQECRANEEKE